MGEITPTLPDDYKCLLAEVEERVRSDHHAALKAVNNDLSERKILSLNDPS